MSEMEVALRWRWLFCFRGRRYITTKCLLQILSTHLVTGKFWAGLRTAGTDSQGLVCFSFHPNRGPHRILTQVLFLCFIPVNTRQVHSKISAISNLFDWEVKDNLRLNRKKGLNYYSFKNYVKHVGLGNNNIHIKWTSLLFNYLY